MPVETESTTEIFESLSFEAEIPCSVTPCEGVAKWLLICGACGIGRETVCQPHREEFLTWGEWDQIHFDQTCGHNPFMVECSWREIQ